MKKKIKALLLLGLVFLGGCGQASAPSVSSAGTDSQSIDLFTMDTAMTLTAYGDHAGEALEAAKSEIERLDALFSISSESGDIYALNHDHTVALHEDTRALLSRALEVSASTGGIFDAAVPRARPSGAVHPARARRLHAGATRRQHCGHSR